YIIYMFVGQELLAHMDPESDPQLFYWIRQAKNAEAEVDYLIDYNFLVIPIEVKSSATGRLRSLRQFMLDKRTPCGIRISAHPLSYTDGILSIPLYMCGEIRRLISISGCS
ncbi:MAG: DUF4143 domain-containing protein, partial [Oligoflexales bacterium]|nr:DUF4143 domain-containing protein [Oligoflexales bacterium]